MSRKRSTSLRALLVLGICATLVGATGGCGGGSGGTARPPEYDVNQGDVKYSLRPGVVSLPTDGSVTLDNVTDTSVRLSGAVPSLQAGQVLLSTRGQGLLRKVTAVTGGGGQVTVQTQQASVQDLFENVDIARSVVTPSFDRVIPAAGVTVLNGLPAASSSVVKGTAQYEYSVNVAKIEMSLSKEWSYGPGTVALTGTLSVGVPVEVKLRIDWLELKEFKFMGGVEAEASLTASLTGQLESKLVDEVMPIAAVIGSPIPIGPIVLVPVVNINLHLTSTLTFEVSAEVGLTLKPSIMVGAHYLPETGWHGEFDPDNVDEMADWVEPTVDLKGAVELTNRLAAPELDFSLLLWGLVGPHATAGVGPEYSVRGEVVRHLLQGYDEISATRDLSVLFDAEPGIKASILGFGLADWTIPLKKEFRLHVSGYPQTHTVPLNGAVPVVVESSGRPRVVPLSPSIRKGGLRSVPGTH